MTAAFDRSGQPIPVPGPEQPPPPAPGGYAPPAPGSLQAPPPPPVAQPTAEQHAAPPVAPQTAEPGFVTPDSASQEPAAPDSAATQQAESPFPPAPEEQVVNTQNERLGDGVNRCPRCGSTEIQQRPSSGMLICLFCRHEWNEATVESASAAEQPISELRGTVVGTGAADIDAEVSDILTLKCQGCGSEVVINTAAAMSARCHWCRHTLTVNNQVPNGAVPDAVLPFALTHQQAVEAIRAFANKRQFFAHRQFLAEFTPENVTGVYLPYMVIDANVSSDIWGHGEVLIRSYTRGSGDDETTYYDADVYQVQRHVDFTVDDLTIESSAERANMNTFVNTNNVINTILPFDTKNAVRWNASYLTGFTSEKRDQNIDGMRPVLEHQLMSIARSEARASVKGYNRGVRWEHEKLDVHGTRWNSMYLPVWLYSYYHEEKGRGMVHYIAVNGRTGETMGSVPVSRGRLLTAAIIGGFIVEVLAIIGLVVS